jgi:predicted aspartyl protease
MIQGFFGDNGELFFEIELTAADGSVVTVDALLDTGFTDWLAMDNQEVDSLGWLLIDKQKMQTARGEFNIPVLGGEEISEVLLCLRWLENRRLVVDKKVGLLTLGED